MREPQEPLEIQTLLTRSNFCRTFRVDGAWGGITPQQLIHVALFSERWKTPGGTIIRPAADGSISDAPDPATNERVLIREIEADVFLSEETARAIIKWLQEQLAQLQEIRLKVAEQE